MTWTICWILLADGVVLTAALHRNDSGGQQPTCRRYSVSNRPSQDCSSLGLSALPALFADVIALNLANNSFPVIDHFPSSYSNLHTLILDNCAIRKISVQVGPSCNFFLNFLLSDPEFLHNCRLYTPGQPPPRNQRKSYFLLKKRLISA